MFGANRATVGLLLGVSGWAGAQAVAPAPGLPPTAPTFTSAPAAAKAGVKPAHRAQVVYSGGRLEVTANDSSLNQILREISRATGMKITGGVTDERVFGTYGPAAPAEILAGLLDGTGSNMLLTEKASDSDAPAELVLTPRQGGPTPPNPNSPGFNDGDEVDDRPPQQVAPRPVAPVPVPPASAQTPPASGFVSAPTSSPSTEPGTTPGPGTQATGTSDPQAGLQASPNGVETPEQLVVDQILAARQKALNAQQNQNQQPSTPPPNQSQPAPQ